MLKQQYDAKRLILRQSCPQLAQAAADYLKRNRDFLAPFEPVRLPEYFSLPFWQTQMEQDARQARQGQGYRFWLSLPERPEQLIGMEAVFNPVIWGIIWISSSCARDI